MSVGAERDRVKALLTEAVTLLCKNSLHYQNEVEIEGLIGITLDRSEVLLVSIHDSLFKQMPPVQATMPPPPSLVMQQQMSPGRRKRRRKSGDSSMGATPAKQSPLVQEPPVETHFADDDEPIILADDSGDETNEQTAAEQEERIPSIGADQVENEADQNVDSTPANGDQADIPAFSEASNSSASDLPGANPKPEQADENDGAVKDSQDSADNQQQGFDLENMMINLEGMIAGQENDCVNMPGFEAYDDDSLPQRWTTTPGGANLQPFSSGASSTQPVFPSSSTPSTPQGSSQVGIIILSFNIKAMYCVHLLIEAGQS